MKSHKIKRYSKIHLLENALTREREAKEKSEYNLEMKSIMLGHVTSKLKGQLETTTKRNKEISYLNSLSWILYDAPEKDLCLNKFLDVTLNFSCWDYGAYLPILGSEENNRSVQVVKVANSDSETPYLEICNQKLAFLDREVSKKYYVFNDNNISLVCYPLIINYEVNGYVFFISRKSLYVSDSIIEVVSSGVFQLANYFDKTFANNMMKKNFEELKLTQRQLVHSEKMASLGVIVSGVAHEINNPLSFVLSNVEMLNKYFLFFREIVERNYENVSGDEKDELDFIMTDYPLLLEETLTGVNRVKDIVSDLKTFSHADDKEKKFISVEQCIESSLKIATSEFKNKCKIQKFFSSTPEVYCYPGQIVQVFTNLLVNAAHAIEEYGTIYITTYEQDGFVVAKVRDEGVGISEENLKNIFTPFFTTKKIGTGTGLGLSITYGIVKKHCGEIEVVSREHVGTEFVVKLPCKGKEHL